MSDSKSFQSGAATFTLDNEAGSSMYRAVRQFIAELLVKDITSPSISLYPRSLSPSAVAPSSSESSSSGGDVSDGVTFVGNTTSTVLFFLALAVGVLIAVLFVFFTFRYFIRSKYGLHVYPIPHRTLFYSSSALQDQNSLTNVELQEQINYVRDNNYIRGEILARRINRGRNRRRRRGGRYSRMKKLTEQEVEILFPKKTYYDWLNGGQERDHEIRDGVLQEESMLACTTQAKQQGQDDTFDLNDIQEENLNRTISHSIASDAIDANQSPITKAEGIEMQNMKLDQIPHATHVSSPSEETEDDLHFTSGTCAICLEVLENDDDVRGLICGHVFHSDCLDPWLTKRRACCPMCKRDYFFKDEHNNSVSQQGEGSSTSNENGDDDNTSNNQNNDADDDYDDIDIDAFRNDPALTALLQELVPLHERVRTILNDTSMAHLNIEQRANEIASKKRKNALKVVWWKIMGISKEDLFNWAVITIHRQERQNIAREASTTDNTNNSNTNEDSNTNDNNDDSRPNAVENTIHTRNNSNPSELNDSSAIVSDIPATNEHPSVNDITNANTGTVTTESNITPYTSNSRQLSATDISRDIVEQRV